MMNPYTYPGAEPRDPDVQRVADFTGIPYHEITGRDRHLQNLTARQACMYILIHVRHKTLYETGRILQRHHATCYSGVNAFKHDLNHKTKRILKFKGFIEFYKKKEDCTPETEQELMF